jgi:cyclopropane fatty-acyl-phospholipid synthase-like methyltransferase
VADIGDEYTFRQIAGQYDLVVAFGVLHHLDNKQVLQGLTGARAVLGEQGAFLAAEPCWYSDEKPIERLMKRFDRGGFIRDADGYMQLVSSVFQSAVVSLEVGQMAMQYGLAVITGAQ